MNLVELKGVSYQYPTGDDLALNGIHLSISEGHIYALIGENGGGKTTLCNLIRGFIPHFYKGDLSGEVSVFGKDIRDIELSDLAPKIGYVSQNPFTQITGSRDTVFEEIAFGLENLGVDPEEITIKVDNIIQTFDIGYLKYKNPNELSGGQKQRVALAAVVVMEPDLLIIDEPTSQLDPVGTEDVFKIVRMLKDEGKTVILVENKIELVAEYADYIYLIQKGKVMMHGTTDEVLTKEEALEFGSFIPQYASFGLEMKNQQMPLDFIPTKEQETIKLLKDWIRRREQHEFHSN